MRRDCLRTNGGINMATIRKIKNSKKGSYQIIVSNGYDANNKQIRVTTTFTPDSTKSQRQQEKQIQAFAIDFERQVKTGKIYDGYKISFGDFVKEWEEKEAKQNLEETTLYSYREHLKNIILPALEKYKISNITPIMLEQFYRSLAKGNARKDGKGSYKISSIRKFHKIISGIMRTAVRWNVIEENPCDKVELPRERNKNNDVKHFTFEQTMTFLEAIEKPYNVRFTGHKITVPSGEVIELDTYTKERMLPIQFRIFYRLSLFGGLRKGELIALTWEDIDFENNILSINKSAGHIQKGQIIKTTKTTNSNRVVPIPKTEIELLSRWKTEQKNFMLTVGSKWEGYRGKEFDKNNVFIQTNINYGKTMNLSTPYRKFVTFINYYNQTVEKEEDKLPLISLHGLRHTCATLNIALGTDIKTVQAILGHANVQTTLNTYTHAIEEKKREAVNTLEILLNKQA